MRGAWRKPNEGGDPFGLLSYALTNPSTGYAAGDVADDAQFAPTPSGPRVVLEKISVQFVSTPDTWAPLTHGVTVYAGERLVTLGTWWDDSGTNPTAVPTDSAGTFTAIINPTRPGTDGALTQVQIAEQASPSAGLHTITPPNLDTFGDGWLLTLRLSGVGDVVDSGHFRDYHDLVWPSPDPDTIESLTITTDGTAAQVGDLAVVMFQYDPYYQPLTYLVKPAAPWVVLGYWDNVTDNLGYLACYKIVETAGAQSCTISWTDANTSVVDAAIAVWEQASSGPTYTLTASGGTYALTGTAAALKVSRKLVAAGGTYALTGAAATLKAGRKVVAESGSYVLTGASAGLVADRKLIAGSGSYALTGTDATLTYDPAGATYTLSADGGSYTLTGQAATLKVGRVIVADVGTYALTGVAASLRAGRALSAGSGAYTLTGGDAGLKVGRALSAAGGVYTLTGSGATLTYTPAGGAYTLTCDTGAYSLTGGDVTLTYSGATHGGFNYRKRRQTWYVERNGVEREFDNPEAAEKFKRLMARRAEIAPEAIKVRKEPVRKDLEPDIPAPKPLPVIQKARELVVASPDTKQIQAAVALMAQQQRLSAERASAEEAEMQELLQILIEIL